MNVSKFRSADDPDDGDPSNVVDADTRDPEEDALKREAVENFVAGRRLHTDAEKLREAESVLYELGYADDAKNVASIATEVDQQASSDISRGLEEIKHAGELHRAHPLVALVVREPQQLATWQGAVKTITHAIKTTVSDDVFIQAAAGDAVAGRSHRSELIAQGEWLSHVPTNVTRSAEEILTIVIGVVNFVASVMTILDHVPMSVRNVIRDALTLLPAIAR